MTAIGDAGAWERHDRRWRAPADVISQWHDGASGDARTLRARVHGPFWELLADRALTLLVTREYEHLVVALCAPDGRPRTSWFSLPHPSGLAVDRARGLVHVASTRNPNQIVDLRPATAQFPRADSTAADVNAAPLVPVRSRYLPGCTYIHDLAIVAGELHVDAVGLNAIVVLDAAGRIEPVWWPESVDAGGRPDSTRNYIQLNSIAAGADLAGSFFTASSERPARRRPGHRNYPVDGRGVLFAGSTRAPLARGLTRPHSARLRDGRVWLANSGYGELGVVDDTRFIPVTRLPGWTRGLALADDIAFAGTSRVIPRFRGYAPGLDVDSTCCAIHAVALDSGTVLASLVWPRGNQIFAIEALSCEFSRGFAAELGDRRVGSRLRALYYRFDASDVGDS